MITLVEHQEQRERLRRLCEKTAFGCKIAAVVSAYGFDKGFACFWLDEATDVIFCCADDVMILSGTLGDPAEAKEFLRVTAPGVLLCAVRNAEALGCPVSETGDVLKKLLPDGEAAQRPQDEVNIRELYELLAGEGMVEEFEPFYLDLSHRLRHGAAMAFTERREGRLAGCAIVSSISESAVLLSAVAVAEPDRRRGVGSGLVRRVEAAFPGKTVYVFREKDQHREFYQKLGYAKADTWVVSKR